ncbi:MAG: FmdB family transcriptional regulator [Chloroflexota bacterium]|nr:MAG: FmdB family transcriptional regulator [Chloroflexota bacterium]
MPIYDYTCSSCGHLTEVIHGMGEGGPRFCPSCGVEGTMRKGFAAPAVHFKGSGWAKKDRSATASPGRSRTKTGDEAGAGGAATTSGGGGDGAAGSSSSSTSTSTSSGSATATTTTTSSGDGGD